MIGLFSPYFHSYELGAVKFSNVMSIRKYTISTLLFSIHPSCAAVLNSIIKILQKYIFLCIYLSLKLESKGRGT